MFECINGWTKAKMVEHIKKEFKGKSIIEHGDDMTCVYRGNEGAKCAVGLFIPDELYSTTFEGKPAGMVINSLKLEEAMPLTITGMVILQRVHDKSQPKTTLSAILNWIENNVKGETNV